MKVESNGIKLYNYEKKRLQRKVLFIVELFGFFNIKPF